MEKSKKLKIVLKQHYGPSGTSKKLKNILKKRYGSSGKRKN